MTLQRASSVREVGRNVEFGRRLCGCVTWTGARRLQEEAQAGGLLATLHTHTATVPHTHRHTHTLEGHAN